MIYLLFFLFFYKFLIFFHKLQKNPIVFFTNPYKLYKFHKILFPKEKTPYFFSRRNVIQNNLNYYGIKIHKIYFDFLIINL